MAVVIRLGAILRRPTDSISSHPKSRVFLIHMWFLCHETESAKTKNIEGDIFGQVSKKLILEILGKAQTSLFIEGNSRRKHVTVFGF